VSDGATARKSMPSPGSVMSPGITCTLGWVNSASRLRTSAKTGRCGQATARRRNKSPPTSPVAPVKKNDSGVYPLTDRTIEA
jgi:hypothetical protein